MIRLIILLIVAVLAVVFIGLNLSNLCTVSVIFYTFNEVPVYLVVLLAFLLGVIITIPLCLVRKGKFLKSKKEREELKAQKAELKAQKAKGKGKEPSPEGSAEKSEKTNA